MASSRLPEIESYLTDHSATHLAWLDELCRQRSISAERDGVAECAELVVAMCERVGLTVERLDTSHHPVFLARRARLDASGGDYLLGLYNHYDVQPVEPLDEWHSDPFVPTERDGRLYARGIADNKGNLVARLAAIDAWLKVTGDVPVDIAFIIDGDEEIGSPGLAEVAHEVQERLALDGLIWESGSANVDDHLVSYQGIKGMLTVTLECRADHPDLHSLYATVATNPAWRLVRALATLVDDDGNTLLDGYLDTVRAPSDEDRQRLAGYAPSIARSLRANGAAGPGHDDDTALVLTHDFGATANLNSLVAGHTGEGIKTVVPGAARACIDLRLVPGQHPDDVLAMVRKHLDTRGFEDVLVTPGHSVPPYRSPGSASALSLAVERAGDELYGATITHPTLQGAGPMHMLCERPAWAVSGGPGVSDYLSAPHAPNESIVPAHLLRASRGIARVMAYLGGT